jgi:putative iron-dependent peroxidase
VVDSQSVIAPPAKSAVFLVFTIASGCEGVVRDLLPDLAGLRRSVGFRSPDADLTCVAGIGCSPARARATCTPSCR